MELKLNPHLTPFNLEHTLQCGQVFRWKRYNDWNYGIVERHVFKVKQTKNTLEFRGVNLDFIMRYFRLDDNLPKIMAEVNRDSLIGQAIRTFSGLRIVRQSPWECLISFICATCKNIPSIKNVIHGLSNQFGEKISFENREFHTFPTPSALAELPSQVLRDCKLGFRANFIRETAEIVDCGKMDFEALRDADYQTAKERLLQLPGVGNKVADCVLLFSLEKLEAFPVDIWMKRVFRNHYKKCFDMPFAKRLSGGQSLSSRDYDKISSFARRYFGKFAGYAQEYLYYYARARTV